MLQTPNIPAPDIVIQQRDLGSSQAPVRESLPLGTRNGSSVANAETQEGVPPCRSERIVNVTTTTCTVETLIANAPFVMRCVAPEETPMWTDEFSAYGTVGATIVALALGAVSLFISVRDHMARLQQDEERAEHEHQAEQRAIRSQAQRVACWLQIDLSQYPSHKIIAVNASDEPVWDVHIHHASIMQTSSPQFPVIAPGQRREIDCRHTSASTEDAVDIRFNDNRGRRWFRPSKERGGLRLEAEAATKVPAKETATAN
jgi:hypothetical protein